MSLPAPKIQRNSIPVLSFFTGAGFMDIGFISAGFETVWHNEYDGNFVRGFEHGMLSLFGPGHPKIENTKSITDLTGDEVLREAFGSKAPDVFGVIGGPPCPDFSVGGKNRGGTGTRGQLSSVYVDRVLEIQPTFFVMENVPGLARTAKHRVFLNGLIKRLSHDYVTDLRILNALEFGAPQDRERMFLVGFNRSWLSSRGLNPEEQEAVFQWPCDARYENAKTRFHWPSTAPLGGSPRKPAGVPRELTVGHYVGKPEQTRRLPNGEDGFRPYSHRFAEVLEGDTSRKSFKRLHRWRYSPTAAYGNNEVHLHPFEPRRLTVREALRIQTVPDNYDLPADMPLSHKFKTIGNGVPVKLAEAVAASIRRALAVAEQAREGTGR